MPDRKLQVRVLLNKGKAGVSLHKLPRMLADIQRFLDSLAEDTVGRTGDWMGLNFRSTSSIEYLAESDDAVTKEKGQDFHDCLRGIVHSKPDPKIRRATLLHYSKIASPSSEETVAFGIQDETSDDAPSKSSSVEWMEFSKSDAANLANLGQVAIRSVGGIQGIIHAVYLGSPERHFMLRELSTGDLVKCEYDESLYSNIVEALKRPRAVIHAYGMIHTDISLQKIQRLHVSRIEISAGLSLEALERFIGCAPDAIMGERFQRFIDESRGRG